VYYNLGTVLYPAQNICSLNLTSATIGALVGGIGGVIVVGGGAAIAVHAAKKKPSLGAAPST
jgi:hypothetical protein